MADIIITPGSSIMSFTSSANYTQTLTQDASGSLVLQGSGSTGRTDLFTVTGNNGTLFSVSDDLSDSLFSVNTIAGLPVIEAFANNTVTLGQYGQNVLVVTGSRVGIGTSAPSSKLHLQGTTTLLTITDTSYNRTSNIGYVDSANLYFANDNNSNTYIGAYNNLFLAYGGGNVGIGTSSNLSALTIYRGSGTNAYIEVAGNGNTPGSTSMVYGQDSVGDGYVWNRANRPVYFGTNNGSKMVILAGGNVGIGTTNPSSKLQVSGTSLFEGEQSIYYTDAIQTMVGGTGYSLFRMYGNSNGVEVQLDAHASNSSAATIGTFSNSNFHIKTNNTNRMVILAGGNVGIGTTNPGNKFVVNGGVSGTPSWDNNTIEVRAESGLTAAISLHRAGYTTAEIYSDNGAIAFRESGADRLRITSGNVGIGTTNPSARLDIRSAASSGATNAPTFRAFGLDTDSYFQVNNNSNNSADITLTRSDSATMFSVDGHSGTTYFAGNVGIGSTNPQVKLDVLGTGNFGSPSNTSADYGLGIYSGNSTGGGDYSRIRFYQNSTNIHTIHSFSTNWQGGTIYNASAGALNLDGLNGVTIGGWNGADAIFVNGGASYFKGNVGIGTTNPTVISNYRTNTLDAPSGTFTEYRQNGTALFRIGADGSRPFLYGMTNAAMDFFTNTSLRMTIAAGGNVGIGTTNPGSGLEISGPTGNYASGIGFVSTGTGARTYRTYMGTNGSFYFDDATAGATRLTLNSSGYVGIGTTSPSSTLDVNGYITTSDGNLELYKSYTVDMSNTGTYSTSNYYPVIIPISTEPVLIQVQNNLNSNVPSWATHPAGFTLNVRWITNGSGWGTTQVKRKVQQYYENWASTTICGGITQMTQSSTEVIWLRGGGTYFFKLSRNFTPSPQASTYTSNGQSVSPTSTAQNTVWNAASGTENYYAGNIYASTFYDADNTGYYLDPANISNLYTSYFGGVVGIGTTNPSYKLDVNGGSDSTVARFYNSSASETVVYVGDSGNSGYSVLVLDSNANAGQIWKGGASYSGWGGAKSLNIYNGEGPIAFHSNNTANSMFLDTSGNLGIGTTSPQAKLDVGGGDGTPASEQFAAVIKGHSGGNRTLYFDGNSAASVWWGAGNTPQFAIDSMTGGGATFWTHAGGTWIERMRFKADGSVGIGTTNPLSKFQVNVGTNQNVAINSANGVSRISAFNDDASSSVPLIINGSDLRFTNNTTEAVRITSGNVGIGTTNPGYTLDVNGTFHVGGNATFNGTYTNINSSYITVGNNSTDVVGVSGNTMYFPGNDKVGIGTTNPGATLAVGTQSSGTSGAGVAADNSIIGRFGAANTAARVVGLTVANTATATIGNDSTLSFIVAGNYSATGLISTILQNTSTADTDMAFSVYANSMQERMRIKANGNVGIGTTTMYGKLSVSSGNFDGIRIDTNSGYNAISIGGTGAFSIDAPGISSGRFVVTNGGNVGIGTASPGYKLEVIGTTGLSSDLTMYGGSGYYLRLNGGTGALGYDSGNNQILSYTTSDTTMWMGSNKSQITPTVKGGITEIISQDQIQNDYVSASSVQGTIITKAVSGAAVTIGQVIVLNTANQWVPADADAASTSTKLLGVALTTVSGANSQIAVLLDGIYNTSIYHDQVASPATPGMPLYISTNSGYVTQTAPSGTGKVVRLIGHNLYGTTGRSNVAVIRFKPDNTWIQL